MEGVAKGDPGEAVSIQSPWATFYGARNNELLQRKTGNRITGEEMPEYGETLISSYGC
jgi:hypothetical protein